MNVTIDTVAKICEALGLRLEAVSASETKQTERDLQHDVTVCKLRRGIKFSFYRK